MQYEIPDMWYYGQDGTGHIIHIDSEQVDISLLLFAIRIIRMYFEGQTL